MMSGVINRNCISCILVALTTVAGLVGAARAGSLRVIAKYGDPAPGSEGNFRTFLQPEGADPAISGRNIAFGAAIDGGGGVYAYIDGELWVIADTNTHMPGTSGHFGFPGAGGSPSISGRNVAFGAASVASGSIWMYRDGSLITIADVNTPVPAGTGTFRNFALGNGASPSISGQNVAFLGVGEDRNGVYAYINGELRMIADSATPVPGAPFPFITFTNFGQSEGTSPSISGENVAFAGRWGSVRGVHAYINGKLRFIADSTTTGGTFGLNGGGPSISGENVAFLGGAGIYACINGELRFIADSDTPAPGAPGTFGVFPVSPVISGENVVFGAESIPGLGSGIFAYINGSLGLIAGENTLVPGRETTFNSFFLHDGAEGEDVRPAISGENVVFTASPNGVYAYFPPTHGDFDDNDCLDLRDIGALQRCFGTTTAKGKDPNPCVTVFDFDANGSVDLADYALFLAALTPP